jgi:uncharacterized membrane protein
MRDIAHFVYSSGPWMTWNLVLVALAWSLVVFTFDKSNQPRRLWWVAAAASILLLPNTAYVLTDIVHLPTVLRREPSELVELGVILPSFAALFLIGFAAYVDAVRRMTDWLRAAGWMRTMWPAAWTIHAVTAVGIYAGRMHRFNSWDIVTHPFAVITSTLAGFGRPLAVTGMLIVFAFLLVGYTLAVSAFELLSQKIARPRNT